MYYLTKIDLRSSKRVDYKREDNFMYILHGIIYRAFNEKEDKKLFSYLEKRSEIYIFSEKIPNKEHLIKEFNKDNKSINIYKYDKVIENLYNGKEFEYGILFNPSKQDFKHNGRGSVRALIKNEEQEEWLKRKGEELGFKVLSYDKEYHRYYKCKNDIGKLGVRSTGRLKITDSEKFKQCLINGIGRCKSFGFGLLLVNEI